MFNIVIVNEFKLAIVHFARPNPMQTCACAWISRWTKNRGKSGLGRWAAGWWAAGLFLAKPKLTLCYVLFQVGTVDPVGDFRTLISQRDEDKFDEGMLSLSPTELVNHSVSHLISAKQQLAMCRLRFEIPKTNKILAK